MRWLGGDLHWLLQTIRERDSPDAVAPPTAVAAFLADFVRPTHYDYVDPRDPAPVAYAIRGFLKRIYRHGVGGLRR